VDEVSSKDEEAIRSKSRRQAQTRRGGKLKQDEEVSSQDEVKLNRRQGKLAMMKKIDAGIFGKELKVTRRRCKRPRGKLKVEEVSSNEAVSSRKVEEVR
jgi:hypothetical protein